MALALANKGVITAPEAALAVMLSISMVGSLAKLEVFSENMRQVKFTVAKLIARFWDVTSGAITIGGVNVKDMPLSQQAISALSTIKNADQILVVDDGRIAQHGTHDQLVKQEGLYRRFTAIRQQAEGWRIAAE